jgi:hypothetical protein
MKNQCRVSNFSDLLWTGLVVVTLLFALSNVVSAGDAPSFLQINKSYSGSGYQFTVLEIGKDGWIKVVLRERNELAWINTNATPMIAPYPAQEMNAPAAAPGQ